MDTNPTAEPGLVFEIPFDDGQPAVGVVVSGASPDPIFVAVFEAGRTADASWSDWIASSEPELLGWTVDAKIWHRRWTVLSSIDIDPARFPRPSYKIAQGRADNLYAVSFSGRNSRPATAQEAELLSFRKTFAPAVFEKAIKAQRGLLPWEDRFDELSPDLARRRELLA